MTDEQKTWIIAQNRMMDALTGLGFPEALGDQIVRIPTYAMDRMTSYLKFDMDGTVLNTLEDLTVSVNYVLSKYNMSDHAEEEYRKFFGNSIKNV